MDRYSLPTNEDDLGAALYDAVRYAQRERNRNAVRWGAIRWFLAGVRRLNSVNYETGIVEPMYDLPGDGIVYEEALGAIQSDIARMMKVDVRPIVSNRGMGLDSIRRAAIANSTLTYHNADMAFEASRRKFATTFCHYGKVGLMTDLMPARPGTDTVSEWRGAYRLLPPWELLGIPGEDVTPNRPTAIVVEQWVPYTWLQQLEKSVNVGLRPPIKLPPAEELVPLTIPFGAPIRMNRGVSSIEGVFASDLGHALQQPGTKLNGRTRQTAQCQYVQFCQWFFSEDGVHLDAYLMHSKHKYLGGRDYWKDGIETWNPLGVADYCDTGGFYPKGTAEPRINLNRITEHLLEQILRIVDEFDSLGHMFYEQGIGIRREDFQRPSNGGPKVSAYSRRDPMNPTAAPFHQAQPTNPASLPGQVFSLIEGLTDRVMPQLSIFSPNAPRRAETQGSLAYIDAAANEPRSPAADSMADCWITNYRWQLDSQRRFYGMTGVIPITQFSDHIVGVVYDPKVGGIAIEKNAIPTPREVDIKVFARMPKDPAATEAALIEEVMAQRMTVEDYRIKVRLLGIDRPVGADEEWEAYQMAQFNIIMAFGNGTTPGEVMDPLAGPVKIHIQSLIKFMAGPRFAVAAPAVRKVFKDMLETYKTLRGDFADNAPYPDEAAAMEEARMKQMEGMEGQMGMPMGGEPSLQQLTNALPDMMLGDEAA